MLLLTSFKSMPCPGADARAAGHWGVSLAPGGQHREPHRFTSAGVLALHLVFIVVFSLVFIWAKTQAERTVEILGTSERSGVQRTLHSCL